MIKSFLTILLMTSAFIFSPTQESVEPTQESVEPTQTESQHESGPVSASVFKPYQGGTGVGSALVGEIGTCLKVSNDSPFTYELGTCGTGGGGGSGNLLYSTAKNLYSVTTTTGDWVIGANATTTDTKLEVQGNVFFNGNATTTGYFAIGSGFNTLLAQAGDLFVGNNATVTATLHAPEICIDNDCQTAWPTGGSGDISNWSSVGNYITPTTSVGIIVNASSTLVGDFTQEGSVLIKSADGINYSPGSDTDADLITVDVTGSPSIKWSESSDGFFVGNSGLIVSSDGNGDLTHSIAGTSVASSLEVHSEGSTELGGIAVHRHTDANNFGGHQLFLRSGGTHDSPTAVSNNDVIGRMIGLGYDGTDYELGSEIQFLIDGTPSNNNMPGEIKFFTNAGSQSLVERMSIDSTGLTTINNGFLSVASSTVLGNFRIDGNATSTGKLAVDGGNSDQWNTAFSWGDHSSQGYVTDLSSFDTGDLTEGSNLYYTQARFDSAYNATTTLNGFTPSDYLATASLGTGIATWLGTPSISNFFTALTGEGTGVQTFLTTPSSANLRSLLTDETGTGIAYFVGGALGTPSSGTLTNTTGLPVSTGISGLGTGIATFLATPSSANLASAITNETGSAGSLVFSSAPSFTTRINIDSSQTSRNVNIGGSVNPTIRLAEGDSTTSYSEIRELGGGFMRLDATSNSGSATIAINPFVTDGSSNSIINLFPDVSTSGSKTLVVSGTMYATEIWESSSNLLAIHSNNFDGVMDIASDGTNKGMQFGSLALNLFGDYPLVMRDSSVARGASASAANVTGKWTPSSGNLVVGGDTASAMLDVVGDLEVSAGADSYRVNVGGSAITNITASTTSDTTEQTLVTEAVGGSFLSANGDSLWVRITGRVKANGSETGTVRLKFGSQTIFTESMGALGVIDDSYTITCSIMRITSTTQLIDCDFNASGTLTDPSRTQQTAGTQTLSSSNNLVVTGQVSTTSGTNQQVTYQTMQVDYKPVGF